MLARFGKIEEADDAGVVEAAHDLNFLEDVGALFREGKGGYEGKGEERRRVRGAAEGGRVRTTVQR